MLIIMGAVRPQQHATLNLGVRRGCVKAKTGVSPSPLELTPGYTKKQPGDKPKCKPGDCTGNGCLVLVNERYATLDSKGKVSEGGIVSDCLNCILMGIACPSRKYSDPAATASTPQPSPRSDPDPPDTASRLAPVPPNRPPPPARVSQAEVPSDVVLKVHDRLVARGNDLFNRFAGKEPAAEATEELFEAAKQIREVSIGVLSPLTAVLQSRWAAAGRSS
jgi:hypothetical protein